MAGGGFSGRRASGLLARASGAALAGMVAAALAVLFLALGAGDSEEAQARPAKQPPSGKRPNIVFVMTDDMPERLLPAMPAVWNRVARGGVRFQNAYVTQSVCCPSRATVLRGQYPHNHGVLSNQAPDGGEPRFRALGRDGDTVATRLRRSGYRTAFVGNYMNLTEGNRVPPGWTRWYGRTGPTNRPIVNDDGRIREFRGHPTDVYRKVALDFLRQNTDRPSDPPFMLFVWTNAPHMPGIPARRHAGLYAGATLPKTAAFNEADVSDKPRWVRDLPPLTAEQAAALDETHRYQLRSLRAVDEMVRSFVDLLRQRRELDNTYIVFGTDNGVHMGEHRWHFSRGAKSTPYEEAAGVPLVVRGPSVPAGAVRDQLVANNDLAPTFMDWANVRQPAFTDGRSLAPLLKRGANPPWRTALLNERRLTQPDDLLVPNYDAVITKEHTYVEYATGERELYDRRTDPYQIQSIHDTADPALISNLDARLETLKNCSAGGCRAAEGG